MRENNETVLPAALSPVFRMPEMTDEMRDAILLDAILRRPSLGR